MSYAAGAEVYAREVLDGERVACEWVKKACSRHLDDLARQSEYDFPYHFDEAAANEMGEFLESLPHVKGRWARDGKLISLEPWQCFVYCMPFGWKRESDNLRRFRVIYVEVPRKNAKSTGAAGIGLKMFGADDEFGAEVYSGATNEKQAWEVFRPAKQMVDRTDDLRDAFGINSGAKNLSIPDSGSRFEPIIGKPGDGASPSCAIIDEYHEHDSDDQYDTMMTGMGAREQPMMLVITTAGDNTAGPCYALRTQVVDMLNGTIPDEELFGVIYTIDEKDDWTTEAAIEKANPNIGVSASRGYLLKQQRDAINHPRKQATFKTKHLGVWVSSASPYFNAELWNRLGDTDLRIEDFYGEPCYVGLDLSQKLDIAGYLRCFKRMVEGDKDPHYYVFPRLYLPEKRIKDPEKKHYSGWFNSGLLESTPGDRIANSQIQQDIIAADQVTPIAELAYDPWGAEQMAQNLTDEGIQVVEIPQRVQHLSEPMKELDALIISSHIHHDGNPILAWNIANVVAKEDVNENVFPRKERPEKMIDGAVMAIMAIGRAMCAPVSDDIGVTVA